MDAIKLKRELRAKLEIQNAIPDSGFERNPAFTSNVVKMSLTTTTTTTSRREWLFGGMADPEKKIKFERLLHVGPRTSIEIIEIAITIRHI